MKAGQVLVPQKINSWKEMGTPFEKVSYEQNNGNKQNEDREELVSLDNPESALTTCATLVVLKD